MSLFTIILLLLVLVLCIALYFQMKGAKEQSEEGQQLLNDYQKRVNEMEKLLSDYRALEQNFDNVGKGYEQALLAFDKIEEDKQANERARQALENQNNELLASKNKLEQAVMKKKDLIEQAAASIMKAIDFAMPGAQKTAQLVTTIQNLNDVEVETAIERDDNVLASEIAAQAVRMTGIDKADYLTFNNRISEDAQNLMLFTNQAQVARALANLLDNAMKFTASGSVTLLTSTDGSNVEFSVEDTGSGVAADEAENIFKPFQKLNSFFDGNGIGLTVARSIARRLNGDVKLDTDYTGGARFVLTLPL
ncbi:MAG: sensor histidine kinase [Prevotella sp.]|nr:sensor histidine kinase [Prevotella sp.]